jgi:hypothetical protein
LKKKKIKPAMGPFDNLRCRMVCVRDPDGNMIVLHQRKSAAQRRAAERQAKGKTDGARKKKTIGAT